MSRWIDEERQKWHRLDAGEKFVVVMMVYIPLLLLALGVLEWLFGFHVPFIDQFMKDLGNDDRPYIPPRVD